MGSGSTAPWDDFRRLLMVALHVRLSEATLEGLRHREVWEYSLDALWKAVTNALRSSTGTTRPGQCADSSPGRCTPHPGSGAAPRKVSAWGSLAPRAIRLLSAVLSSRGRSTLLASSSSGESARQHSQLAPGCRAPRAGISEEGTGFRVVFLEDPYRPERLRAMGLSDLQGRAVMYAKGTRASATRRTSILTGA